MTKTDELQGFVDGSAYQLAQQIVKLEEVTTFRVRVVARDGGQIENDLLFNALITATTLMKQRLEATRKLGDDLCEALHGKGGA